MPLMYWSLRLQRNSVTKYTSCDELYLHCVTLHIDASHWELHIVTVQEMYLEICL